MLYCSNPNCSKPFNPDGNKFCLSCGSQTLSPLFRNRYRVIQLLGEGGFGRTYEATDTCEDLRTIDQLWVKYSNGRFGFSVQKRIWHSIGGNKYADYKTGATLAIKWDGV